MLDKSNGEKNVETGRSLFTFDFVQSDAAEATLGIASQLYINPENSISTTVICHSAINAFCKYVELLYNQHGVLSQDISEHIKEKCLDIHRIIEKIDKDGSNFPVTTAST